jgi:hypothetical protein
MIEFKIEITENYKQNIQTHGRFGGYNGCKRKKLLCICVCMGVGGGGKTRNG